jgi:hypothetical protein
LRQGTDMSDSTEFSVESRDPGSPVWTTAVIDSGSSDQAGAP